MRDISRAAFVAALMLGLAGPAGAQEAQDAEAQDTASTEAQDTGAAQGAAGLDPEVAEAAAAAQKVWEEAFATGNGAQAAEMAFTEDARLLPNGAPIVEGREAVAEFWQGLFDQGFTNLQLGLIDAELVGEDTLIETGTWEVTVPGEGGSTSQVGGKALVIWKKGADGTWRMSQDMWNLDQ